MYTRGLEDSNALLSSLFEALPVGVLAEDASRGVLAINERMFDLFDLPASPDEVLGADCERLSRDVSGMFVDPDRFVERTNELVSKANPVRDEEWVLEDGRTFSRTYRPIERSGGAGHLWVYRDVTSTKEVLEELTESRERLNLALSAGKMGVWEFDLETRTSPVRSPRHDRIFGYEEPLDEWDMERFLEHVHPDDRETVEASFESAFETGTWEFECRIVRTDGEERWIAVVGTFHFDEDGEPERAIGVIEDVTARKTNRMELERVNERLDQFSSMVTHDIRTPLSIALGRLEMYRERGGESNLTDVETSLNRIEEIVTDLSTLARFGALEEVSESVSIADVAGDAWEMIDSRSATLETRDRTITGDRSQLQGLFENLFRNAIGHGGSDVTVRVGPLPDGFYVEDTGAGIPPEDRERVFEHGYTTGYGGSGFGLTIVQRIANVHGLSVSLSESEEGGARFEFREDGHERRQ